MIIIKPELYRLSLANPLHWCALGFGAGLAPWAPGTFGTLVAIPLWWLTSGWSVSHYITVIVVAVILGVFICNSATKTLGVNDHSAIVWDEMVGFMITMIAAPKNLAWLATGFVLFRLFDIIKPWPISWLDKNIHGGCGIILDDVLAGLLAFGALQAVAYCGLLQFFR